MTDDKKLTVATYNIQFGINSEKIINNIKILADEGANIICIQEVITELPKELIINRILKRLGKNWQASYHIGDGQHRSGMGTGILWNTDLVTLKHDEKILLPKLKKFAPHEKLYYKLVGVSPIPVQRRTTVCYFIINNKPLRVTCLHIDNVGGPLQRMKQLTYLLSQLNKNGTVEREVICGDFNTFDLLKTGYEKKLLHKKIGKTFKDASEDIEWTSDIYNIDFTTSNKLFPWFIKTFNIHIRRRLDYIWVKNMKVISCNKRELSGSDHFPIIAQIEL